MINFHNVNISKLVFTLSAFMLTVLSGCSSAPSVKPGSVLSAPGTTTTVILVRHAERAKEPGESALTPEGRQRAQALVAAIGDREITAIYSPDRGRNRETVQPLATHLGVTITLIPEARLSNTRRFADELVQEVLSKHAGGMVVWAVSRFKKPLMANPPAVLISRQTRNPWAGDLFSLDTGGVFLYGSSLKR